MFGNLYGLYSYYLRRFLFIIYMSLQKISIDIESELYTRIKHDVIDKKTTMSKAVREILNQKWGDNKNGTTQKN